MGVGQLLVLVEVQHGQRDVEVLTLGADVVGRTEAAVLLDLEVVVDEAGPHQPAQYEAQDTAAHDHVDVGAGLEWSGCLSLTLRVLLGAGHLLQAMPSTAHSTAPAGGLAAPVSPPGAPLSLARRPVRPAGPAPVTGLGVAAPLLRGGGEALLALAGRHPPLGPPSTGLGAGGPGGEVAPLALPPSYHRASLRAVAVLPLLGHPGSLKQSPVSL